jgi:hypothetical protein
MPLGGLRLVMRPEMRMRLPSGWSVAGSDARAAEVARRRAERLDERDRVRQAHVALYRRSLEKEHAA